MKILIITVFALLVLSCKASDQKNSGSVSNDLITLSDKNNTIQVNHQDMEVSEFCPSISLTKVPLNNHAPNVALNLCKIKLEGYSEFDARKDFSYINFMNYRLNDSVFTYDVDASLLTGNYFIARCSITIKQSQLSEPVCVKIESEK
ncbi:hypothetical protein [Sessilibacter corallicola]|uniref:Lipoprotein n=1 Tax=Sessilibacter corallicola TaxID=2904075 RepID=A0ABQ0A576_9GAMM